MKKDLNDCVFLAAVFSSLGSIQSDDKLKKSDILDDGYLSIPKIYVKNGDKNADYTAKSKTLQQYSLDEKCARGLDISIGFQVYTPYVVQRENRNSSLLLSGIFPDVIGEMMMYCCPQSKVGYGKSFLSNLDIYNELNGHNISDISFPVYAHNGKHSTEFKDLPFISIVTAPKIVILVPNQVYHERNTRTKVLMKTIFNTWPMLIFIVVSAMLAGLIVWLLDRKQNATEFPPQFSLGAWEGIWWAFVTMTTVGYGDRSPKSLLARAFCIMWILLGIIIICLFTGLVSASLNVSSTPVFNIPGSKIGAVQGSVEYKVGVELNAEMKGYRSREEMLKDLVETSDLHGAMIDNFILSASQDALKNKKLRMQREVHHPVTYGLVMVTNSSRTEQCFRKFIRYNRQKVFEIIKDNLLPVKNPTDDVRVEVEAAEKLFYEETMFKVIVRTEVGLLVAALVFGFIWEAYVMNKDSAAYRLLGKFRRSNTLNDRTEICMGSTSSADEDSQMMTSEIHALISEYSEYHSNWINRVKNVKRIVRD